MKFHQMDPERRRETLVSEGVLTPEKRKSWAGLVAWTRMWPGT